MGFMKTLLYYVRWLFLGFLLLRSFLCFVSPWKSAGSICMGSACEIGGFVSGMSDNANISIEGALLVSILNALD
jgi:hypothetical protein